MTIVPIRPGVEPDPPKGEVNADVVETLEKLLDRARSGEVIGIAYAVQHPERMTSYWRAGFCSRAILGAMLLLQHEMCAADIEAGS